MNRRVRAIDEIPNFNTKVIIMGYVVRSMERLRGVRQLSMEQWWNGKLAEEIPKNLQRTFRKFKFVQHKSEM
jgi:hypothetical protein